MILMRVRDVSPCIEQQLKNNKDNMKAVAQAKMVKEEEHKKKAKQE
jgi:hypothetical protein